MTPEQGARIADGGGAVDAVLCAVGDDRDPAWALLHAAATRQAQAARIVLCATPGPGVLELAARHGAHTLPRPPAPSKLRSLLAQRPVQALRGAARAGRRACRDQKSPQLFLRSVSKQLVRFGRERTFDHSFDSSSPNDASCWSSSDALTAHIGAPPKLRSYT